MSVFGYIEASQDGDGGWSPHHQFCLKMWRHPKYLPSPVTHTATSISTCICFTTPNDKIFGCVNFCQKHFVNAASSILIDVLSKFVSLLVVVILCVADLQ